MKIAPVAQVKAQFSRYLDDAQEAPVVVTRNGRPVAVITGIDDPDDLESLVPAHTPRFRRLIENAQQRIAADGGVPHGEFWATVQRKDKHIAEKKASSRPRRSRT